MHSLSEREKEILQRLAEDSTITVSALSKALGVSTVTVRNHLNTLAEQGLIIRSHGGASVAFHPDITARLNNMVPVKNAIARAAGALVKDRDTIMIEAGTTTSFIASFLRGKRDVHIVTNSTLVVPYARTNPALHLTIVGGEFHASTESLVGPLALRELEQFHVSLAFIGTDGFSLKSGLTTHIVEGAEVVKRMAAQAQKTVLLADSSKYGRTGFAKVLPLSEIDILITDKDFDPEVAEELRGMGIEVIMV